MPITPWISTTNTVQDGISPVSAETINPILKQLTQREQHLYEKFNELSGKSVLIGYGLPILPATSSFVQKNTLVFYNKTGAGDTATEGVAPAKVLFDTSPFSSSYAPANSSFVTGIVKSISNSKADVYLMGLVELDVNIDDETYGLVQSDEIDADSEFIPGPYYLSRVEAGKLTRNPGGLAIYVGYVFNRRTILLAPDVSEFNQFFTSYKFNVLDRPAGYPVLTGTTWDVEGVSPVSGDGGEYHVGWVPVSSLEGTPLESLIPANAKFFYNLPVTSKIELDSGIDSDSFLRDEQIELKKALPPSPVNVSLLTVNGVIQASRDKDPVDGLYSIDDVGIWWYDDQNGQQPWSSDIEVRKTVTFDASNDQILVPGGQFVIGDSLRVTSSVGASYPSGIAANTTYYVVAVEAGATQKIKVSTTLNGSAVNIVGTGSGTFYIPSLYIWKFAGGTSEYRPRISLQFLKFNPALRSSIVTSIKKFNPASTGLTFYSPDKITEAASGDLFARLNLGISTTTGSSTGKAITSQTFNEATGSLVNLEVPVIHSIAGGGTILVTPVESGGVVQPGNFIISNSANNQFGRVEFIEPDGADVKYFGLHSYLSMPAASTLPSHLIGKIPLPSSVPDADLSLILILFGETQLSLSSTANNVLFNFSYAVTKPGSVLGNASTPVAVNFALPTSTALYPARMVIKVGAVNSTPPYSISNTSMVVPATAFKGGDNIVNFKLSRGTPDSGAYTGKIGIADIYWKIG